jgi:hypothetical protein
VACLRGVEPVVPPVRFVTRAELLAELESEPPSPEELERWRTYYAAEALVGLMPTGYEPEDIGADSIDDFAAFYDRDLGEVVILEDGGADEVAAYELLVHEMVHVLQDAEWDLDARFEQHATTFDRMLGIRAVVEGDAVLAQLFADLVAPGPDIHGECVEAAADHGPPWNGDDLLAAFRRERGPARAIEDLLWLHLEADLAEGGRLHVRERVAVDFVERQRDSEGRELGRAAFARGDRDPLVAGSAPHLELPRVVCDQHDLLQRRHSLVVLELLAAVVLLRRRAEDLHDERRVDDRRAGRVVGVLFHAVAHDGHVWIRTEPGDPDANAQVRAEHAAASAAERHVEHRQHVARHRGVLRRTAGHRPDVSVEKLVLDGAEQLEIDVL